MRGYESKHRIIDSDQHLEFTMLWKLLTLQLKKITFGDTQQVSIPFMASSGTKLEHNDTVFVIILTKYFFC